MYRIADSTNLNEVLFQLVVEEKKSITDIQAVDVEVNKLMNDGSRSSAVVTDYRIFFK
jgi:hypothetical protein